MPAPGLHHGVSELKMTLPLIGPRIGCDVFLRARLGRSHTRIVREKPDGFSHQFVEVPAD